MISLQGLKRIFYLVSSLLAIIFLLVFALPARLPLRKARTHKQKSPKRLIPTATGLLKNSAIVSSLLSQLSQIPMPPPRAIDFGNSIERLRLIREHLHLPTMPSVMQAIPTANEHEIAKQIPRHFNAITSAA